MYNIPFNMGCHQKGFLGVTSGYLNSLSGNSSYICSTSLFNVYVLLTLLSCPRFCFFLDKNVPLNLLLTVTPSLCKRREQKGYISCADFFF